MKKILIILGFLLLNVSVYAQYKVLYVKGNVLHGQSSKPLKVGDEVSNEAQILIKSNDAVAAVYNPQYGRILLPKNLKDEALHNSNSAPVLRAAGNPFFSDIKSDINNGQFLVLGEEAIIPLDIAGKKYKENLENGKFEVSFIYDDDDVRHNLPVVAIESDESEDQLIGLKVNKSEFYTLPNGKQLEQYEVFDIPQLFFTTNKGIEKEVGNFSPVFIDDEEKLKKDVYQIIRDQSSNKEQAFEKIMSYLESNYAKPYEQNVEEWLEKEMNFTK